MASEYLKWKYKDVKPDEPVQYTKKELRRNWWDYNLGWVILGIVALIGAFFLIRDIFFRVKPDYVVAVVSTEIPPEETQDALEARLAELGEDLNGDGDVVVEVYVYELGFTDDNYTDVEMTQAAVTRLVVDMGGDEVYLVLTQDPENFQRRFGSLAYLDGAPTADVEGYESENWRDMVYAWTDCPVLEGLDLGTFTRFLDLEENQIDGQEAMRELYIGRRAMLDEEDAQRFAGAERLWEKLTQGAAKAEE